MRTKLFLVRALTLALAAPLAAAQVEVMQLHGEAAGDGFGWTTAFVGDVDGDGSSDLAVGAPFHDATGTDTGRVYVYSGTTSQLIRTWDGLAGEPHFGQSICGVGDLDGDGLADVLVGAATWWGYIFSPSSLPVGYAQVLSGGTGSVLHTFVGLSGGQNFGYAVASGPDLDGDGTQDLLIGAPGFTGSTGYVYVYSGATFAKIRRETRPDVRNFGHAITFLGDTDGDGVEDYAVGAPQNLNWVLPFIPVGGSVFLIDGAGGTDLWSASGSWGQNQLGWSIADIGDQDGDGVDDLIVGKRNAGGGWVACQQGARIVMYSGADGTQIREHPETSFCGAYGSAVAGLGDLNGDGRREYVGGEPGWLLGYDLANPLRVFDGATGALLAQLDPPDVTSSWGFSLATGDTNGDGLEDLVIGAPTDATAGADAGLISIHTIVRTPRSYCEAQVNSQGCTPAVYATGTPSITSNDFRARASSVLNNKNGLLFWGLEPQQKPFGGAFKCVASPTVRTAVQNSGGNHPPDDCSGQFTFHWSATYLGAVGLGPGDEVYCQYWSRDPQAASTSNLTDALAFLIVP